MDDDNRFSYFFLGLGLGVAVGLLFAPKTGAETRDLILSKADEGKEYLKRAAADLKDQIQIPLVTGVLAGKTKHRKSAHACCTKAGYRGLSLEPSGPSDQYTSRRDSALY